MPKISPDHRAARRQSILDAARRCFLRNGFHATSMQDIQAEADLSAGGIYVYFKSKEEIIEAIALDTMAFFKKGLEEVLCSDDLPPLDVALGKVLMLMIEYDRQQPVFLMSLQIWAVLGNTPHLAAYFMENQQEVNAMFRRLIERYQAQGYLDPQVPAEQIAQVLVTLIMGFVARMALLGPVDMSTFLAGLRSILTPNVQKLHPDR